MRPIRLLVAAAGTMLAQGATAQTPDRAVIARQADSLVLDYIAHGGGASAAVAIVHGRDTIVMSAMGLADVDAKREAKATTIYRIGSITKQFTAAIILQLAEQGKLSIDDSIGRFLPASPALWRPIRIRRLLNHTSGIHNYTDVTAWRPTWSKDLTTEEIVAFVATDALDFTPGTKWSYSNTGYVLLGMIIERITGHPYAQVVQERIFKPLGMTRSSYCPTSPPPGDFASGYAAGPNGLQRAPFLSMTHPHAAGALCMTVGDFIRWQAALAGGRVVSPASYLAMTTPEPLVGGGRQVYGFGLSMGSVDGHRTISHGGGVHGFVSLGVLFPDDSVQLVVFSNSAVPAFGKLTQSLQRAALGLKLGFAVAPLPVADRDRLVGMYDLQLPGGAVLPFRMFARDSSLMSQAEGQGEIVLRYLGNKVFGADFDPALRITFVEENGKVTRLTLLQGGATIDGPRRP